MKQQKLDGSKEPVEEKHKKLRQWAPCPWCKRKIYRDSTHNCKKQMESITYGEASTGILA